MNANEIRKNREKLRKIENHIRLAHDDLGAIRDRVGFVDVVHHEVFQAPMLNYVMPSPNKALIPGSHVEQGFDVLAEHNRLKRFYYIQQFFPEFFGLSLNKLGLVKVESIPIWTVAMDEIQSTVSPYHNQLSVRTLEGTNGLNIWQMIWLDKSYRIFETTIEPLRVGMLLQAFDHVVDVVVYFNHCPIAIGHITFYKETAHLIARAFKPSTTPLLLHKVLFESAVKVAQEHECDLLFACDTTMAHLQPVVDLPLKHEGDMVCYTHEDFSNQNGEENHDTVEQLILQSGV